MKKVQILATCVVAVAFGLLAVASASATLWLKNGESTKIEIESSFHGTLLIHHTTMFGQKILIMCTGLLHGPIGPIALDLVKLALGLLASESDLVSCKVIEDSAKVCANATELVLVHPLHLPWHSLLELLMGGETVDHYLNETGKVPGYEALCSFFGKVSCEGLELTKFTGNGAAGAKFEFNGMRQRREWS